MKLEHVGERKQEIRLATTAVQWTRNGCHRARALSRAATTNFRRCWSTLATGRQSNCRDSTADNFHCRRRRHSVRADVPSRMQNRAQASISVCRREALQFFHQVFTVHSESVCDRINSCLTRPHAVIIRWNRNSIVPPTLPSPTVVTRRIRFSIFAKLRSRGETFLFFSCCLSVPPSSSAFLPIYLPSHLSIYLSLSFCLTLSLRSIRVVTKALRTRAASESWFARLSLAYHKIVVFVIERYNREPGARVFAACRKFLSVFYLSGLGQCNIPFPIFQY